MTINIPALAEDLAKERLKPEFEILEEKNKNSGNSLEDMEEYLKKLNSHALMFEDMIKKRVIL